VPSSLSVVWFKRDLRIDDHRPLALAATRGPLIALYVYEPSLLATPEFDASHLVFINQCLSELDAALRRRGVAPTLRRGEVVEVLRTLRRSHRFDTLWSHEETGNRVTFDRDIAVGRWCQANAVAWTEVPQHGVIRRLKTRDGWARRWAERMTEPVAVVPSRLAGPREPDPKHLLTARDCGLPDSTLRDAQPGGESAATATLDSFLALRGIDYQKAMSSPRTAFDSCSRLSTHLAWGSISMRRVAQTAAARAVEIRELREAKAPIDPRWSASLRSFQGRLRWHCHFMQKLEDEPRIEFENFSHAYDGLRDEAWVISSTGAARFAAWQRGETGYPMVDACMQALQRCGWINFRMRAMLVSFASYHLWLHWRPTSVFLARAFLDFEPGIHFSQFQMQSGTTGINTIRIYSPAKQVLDHDPQGEFIRRELPVLARVPARWLAEPHRMPLSVQREAGCIIGRHYPAPIVEHATAWREAREKIAAIRRDPATRDEAHAVQVRHGSRKSGLPQSARGARGGRKKAGAAAMQTSLWDEVHLAAPVPADPQARR